MFSINCSYVLLTNGISIIVTLSGFVDNFQQPFTFYSILSPKIKQYIFTYYVKSSMIYNSSFLECNYILSYHFAPFFTINNQKTATIRERIILYKRLEIVMNNDNSRTNVKKKRVLKNRFKIIIQLVILLLAGGSYFWYLHSQADSAISESHDDIDRDKSDLRSDYVDPKFDNVSILLMGIDASDTRGADEGTRTDALMVATLNKDDKSVKLLSIPRDALVYIPEVGREEKINHAHSY